MRVQNLPAILPWVIMINPRLLVHFRTVILHGNLRRAAEQLGISQPAITKSIKTLEAHIDAQLFTRSSRGLEPTPLGRALATHAEVIVSELLAAEATTAHFRGGSSRSVRMGVGPTFSDWLMPLAASVFRKRYPNTRLLVTVGLREPLQKKLSAGEIDFYVGRTESGNGNSTTEEVLFEDRLAVCCRPEHPLNTGRQINVEELAGFDWAFIHSQGDGLAQPELMRVFAKRGLGPPRTALETDSATLVYALVRESDVLCLRPTFSECKLESIGGLVELPVPDIFPTVPRAIMFRDPRGLSPVDMSMVGILREISSHLATGKIPEVQGRIIQPVISK